MTTIKNMNQSYKEGWSDGYKVGRIDGYEDGREAVLKEAAAVNRLPGSKVCPRCGCRFTTKKKQKKYCSMECGNAYRQAAHRERLKEAAQ